MSQRTRTQRRTWRERALSLLLAAALMAGLVPGLTLPASAEHWADSYLDRLVEWGVLRADQTGNPDTAITRAEFMAVINRAYGYTEKGPIPFTDVLPTDWFYDDVSIAYTAGYMAGTSGTTAAPNDTLTREQAVCILGRNMMMRETPGESLAFADSRDVSDWARGTVKTAVDNYIISGYPDNTFHPQSAISMGQMAVLVTQCVGEPIQQSGDYELGGVFGNVTITAPNVTLRNAVISGDLYISGGVGLGGIKLENVDVLGRIIVSGTGESEGGDASVIMRNVTASEMLVDNMRGKTVTVRADGITNIDKTVVRTSAYLEDNNTDEEGLLHIELDGEPGLRLTLAGRIKEVVNKTPSSYIQVAKGTVAKLTVDEAATNSIVQIDRNTKVNELNLDVATDVIGDGDIGQLNINAPGSVVTMLPDKIYIRPGLTASVAGVIMDYQAAEEGSLDPRLLSGYPAAKDIAPTGFRADFASNKKGTVYWAVSYVSDGSIGEEALISPPSYGSKAITNGSVAAPAGGDEVSAQVSNLVVGGSYYLSALVVDEQGNRSPVKVISFSTPDNTVPAFAKGYPYMSRITRDVAQVTVMPTKSCKLYYALLPQGGQAPTANELKAAAVTGNLGYGVRDVTKNTEEVFTVNTQRLEELKSYVLYLWLTDVDGANSSAVQSLTFTVPDETPPVVDPTPYPAPGGTTGTSVSMRTGLNETGVVFWAVVAQGENYPLPNQQSSPLSKDNILDPETGNALSAKLDSEYAKLGVANGRGALARGQVNVARADTEVAFNITGLEPETTYDLYYVGRDSAGNYSAEVKKITFGTLDTNGPIIYQYFTEFQGEDETERPMANSDVILRFNENINLDGSTDLLNLYEISQGRGDGRDDPTAQNNAKTRLLQLLRDSIRLKQRSSANGRATDVKDKAAVTEAELTGLLSWIDYRYIEVRRAEDRKGVEIVFPSGKAIMLASNTTYFFEIVNVRDNAETPNRTVPGTLSPSNVDKIPDTKHVMKEFTTVFALVDLAAGQGSSPPPVWVPDTGVGNEAIATNKAGRLSDTSDLARMDTSFYVTPQSTKGAGDTYCYDIVFFAEREVSFDLYYRIVDAENPKTVYKPDSEEFKANQLVPNENKTSIEAEKNGWVYLGNKTASKNSSRDWETGDLNIHILNMGRDQTRYPLLKELGEDVSYEFAISVTKWEGTEQQESWDDKFNFRVYMVAGPAQNLFNLLSGTDYTPDTVMSAADTDNVHSIGVPDFVSLQVRFVASAQPKFATHPDFADEDKSGDVFWEVNFGLDNPGTLYYVAVAKNSNAVIQTKVQVTKTVTLKIEGFSDLTLQAGDVISTSDRASATRPDGRTILWALVTEQTKTQNCGALTTDAAYGEHLEYYKVIDNTPDRNNIANGKNAFRSDAYICGSYPYQSLGGNSEKLTITGLTPETEYYIYIVLEAASGSIESRSNVYIFNFKTTETAAPEINLSTATFGRGRVAVKTTNKPAISANINYLLITDAIKKRTDLLNAKFSEYVDEDKTTEYNTYKDNNKKGDNYTVLQALIDAYTPSRDQSVFDYFASKPAKAAVSSLVESEPPPSNFSGSITVMAGDTAMVDHTAEGMTKVTQYYLIAVGTHVSGTSQGFRAISNIVVPDTDPPQISSISTTLEKFSFADPSGSGSTTGSRPHIEAVVTIRFTKEVYWINDTSSGCLPVVRATRPAGNTDNTKQYILEVVGASRNLELSGVGSQTAATSEFVFKLTDWYAGDTITFFSDGLVANSNGEALASPVELTLYLNTSISESKMERVDSAYFVATWKTWENNKEVEHTYTEVPKTSRA